MKNYIYIVLMVCLFLSSFYCRFSQEKYSNKQINKIDSLYSINDIRFIKRLFMFNDSTICTAHFAEDQMVSIKIENDNLFKQFRDSMGFPSDRLIGVQIFGYRCAGCHDFRAKKLIEISGNQSEFNSLLLKSNHKINLTDTLYLDEIHFIKSYLNSLK